MILYGQVDSAHAQIPADSLAVVNGLADTPDHPVLRRKKGRTEEEQVARFPAKIIKFVLEGATTLIGKPVGVVTHPAVMQEVQDIGRWLGRNHFYAANGSVGVVGGAGETRPFVATLSGAMTVRAYQMYALRLNKVLNDHAVIQSWGQYRIRQGDNFFGIGPGSAEASQSRFEQAGVNTGMSVSLVSGLFRLTGTAEWTDHHIADGNGPYPSTRVASPGLPGIDGAQLFNIGVRLRTPLAFYRRPGWDRAVEALMESYWDTNGGAYGFNRYRLLLYQAIPVFWGDRILAVRAIGEAVDQHDQKRIPFFLLPHLGGANTLRGYDNFRFRDKKSFMVNAEYRYPVWDIGINNGVHTGLAADIVLFVDTGLVFDDIEADVTTQNLATSYGGGLRLRTHKSIIGRLAMAYSSEGIRFVVEMGADF